MYFITVIWHTSNLFKWHFNLVSACQSHLTCATHFTQLELTRPAHYNISSHVDCIQPASNMMHRLSPSDLCTSSYRHQIFHCITCTGWMCSTCIKYCAQVKCVQPASNIVCRSSAFDLCTCSHPHQLFFIIHLIQKTYSSRYQISLDFLINFVMPCPNFIHFKCINKYFINLYCSTCKCFYSFF